MTDDLFAADESNTALSPEEQLDLIPSLSTHAELNEAERGQHSRGARLGHASPHAKAIRPSDRLLRARTAQTDVQPDLALGWALSDDRKNLGWEVARITEGMRNAFDDARAWMEFSTYSFYEAAVRLHHRLVVIHPWPNGNGRHSRLIADVIIAAARGEKLTSGSRGNLVAIGDARRRTIEAIKQAYAGNFGTLLAFAQSWLTLVP